MNKNTKLIKNISLIGLGSIASKFLFFLLFPLYTVVLSTEEFGVADTLTLIIQLSLPVFLLMIYDGVMRFALDKNTDRKDVFSITMYIFLIGFTAFVIISFFLRSIDIIGEYYIEFVLFFFVWALHQTLSYFCRGIERVGVFSIAGIIVTVGAVLLNILFLVSWDMGVSGYFYAYIFAYTAAIIFMSISVRLWKYFKSPRKVSKPLAKEMVQYSAPLVINSISWWVCNYAARYIIIWALGYSAAGLFAISTKIPTIVTTLGIIFSQAWRISAVDNFGSDESKKFYASVFDMYSTFSFVLAAGLIWFVKPLASILFANDFYVAWEYTSFLIIGACVFKLADFMITIYTSAKKTKSILKVSLSGAAVCIISGIILVKTIGIQGASIAMLLGYTTVFLYALFDTRKIFKFKINYFELISIYFLLIAQAVIVILDFAFSFFIAFGILILIIFIKRKSVVKLIMGVLSKVIKKNKCKGENNEYHG